MKRNRANRRNASHPVTAYGVVTGYDRHGRKWQQEHYESKSGDARVRAAQLRKLGFKVHVSPLGPQVTPVGTVRMTMLTIPDMDPEQLMPAPDQVKRLNPTPLKARRPLTEAESRKLWAKYAPYFRYLSSRGAPGGGRRKPKARTNPAKYGKPQKSFCEMCGRKSGLKQAPDPSGKSRTLCTECRVGSRGILKAGGPAAWAKKKNRSHRRLMNYGEGNLFNFHGAFTEKAAAVAKEQSIPGAFIRTVWFKDGPRYGVLTQRKNPGRKNSIVDTIRPGDRVTIVDRFGSKRTGRAVMPSSSGGWVLNMGGPHGTPGIASAENIVKVSKRKNSLAWGKPDQQFVHQALAKLFPGKRPEQLTMAELSKVMQLAQALKAKGASSKNSGSRRNVEFGEYEDGVFHPWTRRPRTRRKKAVRRRNFTERVTEGSRVAIISANEPSGPFSIRLYVNDGETATLMYKKAKTIKGARKIAQKMLDQHIRGNPKNARPVMTYSLAMAAAKDAANAQMRKAGRTKWSRADYNLVARTFDRLYPLKNGRRRNYADATELYEKFHGKGASGVRETNLPIADYGNHPELGQLGKMVSLTIGDKEAEKPWKKKIEWGSKEAPDLAAEPGGRQLYLIGGSQDLNGALEALPIDTDKDLLDLGFAYRLEYFTQKKFDNFQPVTYYHDLGEETGDHPRVVYDRVKKRIHLVGGAYKVKPEGIVN